ncbi:hypothetical protein J3362_13200 [Marinobacter sp. NFXS11]|uniref:hypothetical protein n=1 Tax=Marinobacter sp. NFXS11 TaxID=2818432 RepID=UPI000C993E73|nr:hypothetical protein [Rhodopirellula sp.]
MKVKQRGSHQGLLKNREETKRQNTEALWRQVIRLRKEKPSSLWSFKEVWSGAGLKSNVALDSPWNAHVKEAIEDHNRSVRGEADLGPEGQSQRKTLRITNKALRQEIEKLKSDIDKSLSQIAIWESETIFYQRENARLRNKIERLKN